jgi:hypothetical protein
MGTMACCRADSVSDAAGALVMALGSGMFWAWVIAVAMPKPTAMTSTASLRRLPDVLFAIGDFR